MEVESWSSGISASYEKPESLLAQEEQEVFKKCI